VNLSEDAWLISSSQKQAVTPTSAFLSRLQAGFYRVAALWAMRRQRTREAEVLYTFSDRELWDVGLSRSDIPGIIQGTYRRD
jgi:uncharacterized protein YjiS (DUF1127 family)